MTIREATEKDLVPVLSLLQESHLPKEGVKEHFGHFLVAVDAMEKIVGAIGLEQYPDGTALLRSACVEASLQNSGIGSLLHAELLERARRSGTRRIILLTTTAEKYFERKGFRRIPRSAIAGPVTESAEFVGACPESAVCMELPLEY
jgi:amino-acid N-acetyltransferase